MKYGVDIKFSAYFSVDVEAESRDDADEKAMQMFRDSKFPKETNNFDVWSINVEEIDNRN